MRCAFYLLLALLVLSPVAIAQQQQQQAQPATSSPPKNSPAFDIPYYADTNDIEVKKKNGLPVNAMPIDAPHRTAKEVGRWVADTLSVALGIEAGRMDAHKRTIRGYFSDNGWAGYETFLKTHNITKAMRDTKATITTVVNKTPLLLNEGSVDGRYRWLYEVQTMMTFFENGAMVYGRGKKPPSYNFSFNVEIARVPESRAKDEHGLIIEFIEGSAITPKTE